MPYRSIDLHPQWRNHLDVEFELEYMYQLSEFLRIEKAQGRVFYPSVQNIFAALNATPLNKVRVVILGQDPYHGPNQAHGLSFSVPEGVAIPPSLRNIYKEIVSDLGGTIPTNGNLIGWTNQGVLLLNSVLSVQAGQAASHQGRGWEQFTDKIIEILNRENERLVFMLWGAYAHKKGQSINRQKHLVLSAPHPSPLSAHRGFLGCKHFSQANSYFRSLGQADIDWQITKLYKQS
ncbi:MAG: uracil-DNA glycosylase [Arenicella sp.]|jgi:uracil-DNA glycosylase